MEGGGGDEEGEASPASGEGERAPHPEKGSYPCVEDKHGHISFSHLSYTVRTSIDCIIPTE